MQGKRAAIEISLNTAVVVALSISIIILGIALINSIKVELPKIDKGMPPFFTIAPIPDKGQMGTVFEIRVETKNASFIYVLKAEIVKDGSRISDALMYDDGLHDDGKSKDGIYGGKFDSIGQREGRYYINLIINPGENQLEYRNVSSLMIFQNQCIPLAYVGSPENKIDIAIIPSGYTDFAKFKDDALKLIDFQGIKNGFFSYEPFKSNKDKFNFYMVNTTEDLECKKNCQNVPSLVCCNDDKVSKTALQCPADDVLVLIDSKDFCGTSSFYAKVCNAWNYGMVAVHELGGHVFGGLGDEYDYQKTYPQYAAFKEIYPNCDTTTCPKWKSYWSGCYAGCGLSDVYRPTPESCIMYTYVNQFCPVCQKTILGLLSNYRQQNQTAQQAAPPITNSSYVLDINYDKGTLKARDVYLSPTLSPDRKAEKNYDYIAKIVSSEGKSLYTFKFEIPKILRPAPPRENETAYSPVMLDTLNHTILAPYFDNAQTVEVYNQNNQRVLSIDVGHLSDTCGNGICEEYESAIDCPQDCRENARDKICNPVKDNVCDPDCKKNVDPDCQKFDYRILAMVMGTMVVILVAVLLKRKR